MDHLRADAAAVLTNLDSCLVTRIPCLSQIVSFRGRRASKCTAFGMTTGGTGLRTKWPIKIHVWDSHGVFDDRWRLKVKMRKRRR
jgi:hypothetical protein